MRPLKDIFQTNTELEERLKQTSVFLLKLIAVGVAFQTVLYVRPDTYTAQAWLASLTAAILAQIGIELEVQGALLVGSHESYFVNQDCLGWKSMFAFFGLMFASTENLLNEYKYLFVGIIAIVILNIVRIITTVFLSYNGIISFDIIHTVLWRWGLTAVVLLIWIIWLTGSHLKIKRTFKYRN